MQLNGASEILQVGLGIANVYRGAPPEHPAAKLREVVAPLLDRATGKSMDFDVSELSLEDGSAWQFRKTMYGVANAVLATAHIVFEEAAKLPANNAVFPRQEMGWMLAACNAVLSDVSRFYVQTGGAAIPEGLIRLLANDSRGFENPRFVTEFTRELSKAQTGLPPYFDPGDLGNRGISGAPLPARPVEPQGGAGAAAVPETPGGYVGRIADGGSGGRGIG